MRRGSGPAAALLAACLATSVAGAAPGSPVTVSGASPFAACTAGARAGTSRAGTVFPNTEVEPAVAAAPASAALNRLDVIGVWQQDRWSNGGARGLVAAASLDGGQTWTETPLPVDRCAVAASGYTRASDPWVSIGPDGTAYVVSLGVGSSTTGVTAAVSTDGGITWSRVHDLIRDPRSRAFNDKETVTADPLQPGVAYAVWDRQQNGQTAIPTIFARTTNGGQTWTAAQVITATDIPHSQTIGNQIVVLPQPHRLLDFFAQLVDIPKGVVRVCKTVNGRRTCRKVKRYSPNPPQNIYIALIRSSDGGKTWSKPVRVAKVQPTGIPSQFGGPMRTGGFLPEVTADPASGTLYAVWEDGRFTSAGFSGIAFTRSVDGGSHWSAPVQINSVTSRPAFTPSIAVNGRGTVGVTYYDLRDISVPGMSVPAEYWLATSSDGGAHFTTETHVAGPFDMKLAPVSGGLFLGDYQGLTVTGNGFQPFFVITGAGNPQGRTEVVTATVSPGQPPLRRPDRG